MKKKQLICLLLSLLCVTVLIAGCKKAEQPSASAKAPAETAETMPTEEPANGPDETEPDTETAANSPAPAAPAGAAAAAFASEKYVDLENMQFAVNGKVYTLGKTTLQEMIDDGVPFNENDLANAQNNLNKNSESQGFRIVLGEFWTAQVYTMNDTDENKVTAACCVSEVYLPVHENETQDILSFPFPVTMTADELKANAGEPTDFSSNTSGGYTFDTYEYKKDSTKYYGDYGYEFKYTDGVLDYITIDYLP